MTSIASWTISRWPFDMVKFLRYYTIMMHDDGTNLDMYEAYCGTDDVWVATEVISNIIAPSPGNIYPLNWDFADFDWFYGMAFAYMSNGTLATKCYQRDPSLASGTSAITALPSDACPTFISCCNFKGQPILGGIISTNATWTQLGLASVCWGAIGQWEFRPSSNRTAGFIRMPWADWDKGMVLKVARLGERVMVYGNGGSCSLKPYTKDQAVGFGIDDEVIGPGIVSGFHMAGDHDKHLILAQDYNLYSVDETGDWGKNVGFKKLGYAEYMKELVDQANDYGQGTPVCMSYDSLGKRFYISSPDMSYVLTQFGLYETHQVTTGIGRYRGKKLTGFITDMADYEARMVSDTLDNRLRAMKTVEGIEFGADGGSNLYGGVNFKYTYDKSNIFRSGAFKPLGPEGVVYPGVTASDYRIKFKATDYRDGVKLDYCNLKWKLSDKRSVRGLYNANKAQSGQAQ